jgi:hypothetical protein
MRDTRCGSWTLHRSAGARFLNRFGFSIIVVIGICCAIGVPVLTAQTADMLQTAKSETKRIDRLIEDGAAVGRPFFHSVELNTMLPGSGPQTVAITLYYEEAQRSPDSWELKLTLRKAVLLGNLAAVGYRKEYYYADDKLLCYSTIPDTTTTCGCIRVYFQRNTPVAGEWSGSEAPCFPASVLFTRGASVSPEIRSSIKTAVKDAAELARLFAMLNALSAPRSDTESFDGESSCLRCGRCAGMNRFHAGTRERQG